MSADIKVPVLPESVSEGTLLAWRKKPGEAVKSGEHVVDLETDKVVLEVTALADGVLAEILKPEGSVVKSGEAIARIAAGAAGTAATATADPAAALLSPAPREAPPLSPAVRRLVEEHQLDPAAIPASGRDGRLLKEDVQKHLQAPPAAAPAAVLRSETEVRYQVTPAAGGGTRPEQRVPMTRLRARIAERLKAAQNSAAMLTTFNEVNMKPVMDLRARYKDTFEKKYGVKLGFMSFFVRAVVEALKRFPVVNASVDGSDIVYHGYFDIGIAVGSPRGLVVPILRDADQLSLAAVEKAIKDFGERARDGKLGLEELNGGTFSITNGGIFGSMLSTPILNPPQSAILGMHNIVERPVAENGQVVIRPVMYLALSYDHRIIDGREAVQALFTIKECLEDPARLLLEV